MFPQTISDEQLKAWLIEAYTRTDDSPEAAMLRAELYHRGLRRTDIVELAIISLLRRNRPTPGFTHSLN